MLISYIVRLRSDALTEGRLVGEIEAVATRARTLVRSVDQVASFVLATAADQVAYATASGSGDAPPLGGPPTPARRYR